MIARIRSFLAAPVFEDAEQTRLASLVNPVLITVFVAAVIFPAILYLTGTIGAFEIAMGMVVAVMMLGLRYFMRRGYVQLAGTLIALVLFLVTTALIYYDGSILNGLTAFYILVVIMAGLLSSGRSAVGFLVLSLIATLVMVQLEMRGLTSPDPFRAGWPTFFTYGVALIIATILLNLAFNSLQATIRRAVNSEQQQAQANRALEESNRSLAESIHALGLAAEVSYDISQVRDLDAMLKKTVESIRSQFDLYYAQVYLLDETERFLVLKAGSGAVGDQLLARGHRLPLTLASINGTAALEKRSVLVEDTTSSPIFRPNPLLPDTRSEASIPLLVADKLVGVINLQSKQLGGLSTIMLPAIQTLAGQIAVAIENNALLARMEETRLEVEARARQLTRAGWGEFLDGIERSERVGYVYENDKLAPAPAGIALAPDTLAPEHELSVPIQVSGESIGAFRFQIEREWTNEEVAIAHTVANQVAQQLENIRLLTQAEQYRARAELAARRTTREGWRDYLSSQPQTALGYLYDHEKISTLDLDSGDTDDVRSAQPLTVLGESIGELSVAGANLNPDDEELLAEISERLSVHLESIRLFEQTQQALSMTESLYAGGEQIVHANTISDVLQAIIENTSLQNFDRGSILLFNRPWEIDIPETGVVVGIWEKNGAVSDQEVGTQYLLHELPYITLLAKDKLFLARDIQADENLSDLAGLGRSMAIFPLITGQEWVGLLTTTSDNVVYLQADEIRQIESLTDQVAAVVQRKQSEEVLAQRARELQIVAQVSMATTAELDPERLLQSVVDLTKESFNLYHAHVYLTDQSANDLYLVAGAGEVGRIMVAKGWRIPLGAEKSLVARAARSRQGIIVNDVRADPGFLPNELLPDTRSELAVPMVIGENVLGVLDIQSTEANHFTDETLNIQTTLASQIAVALQNARQYEQTQRRTENLGVLNEMGRALAASLDVTSVVELAYQYSALLMDTSNFFVALYDSQKEMLEFPLVYNNGERVNIPPRPMGHGMSDFIIRTREPLLISENVTEHREALGIQVLHIGNDAPALSWLGVPIIYGKEVLGVIVVQSVTTPGLYKEIDRDLLISVASQTAIAIENARIFSQTQLQAGYEAMVNAISQKIQGTTTVDSALQVAIRELGRALGSKRTSVQLRVVKDTQPGTKSQ